MINFGSESNGKRYKAEEFTAMPVISIIVTSYVNADIILPKLAEHSGIGKNIMKVVPLKLEFIDIVAL